MTFPLTPASPFVAFATVVSASWLNTVRTCISQALDGAGGSGGVAYTPLTALYITGAGLRLGGSSALDLDSTSTSTLDAGGLFNVSGVETIENGGFLTVANGGIVAVSSGGLVQVASGGAVTMVSGSNLEVYGAENIHSTGVVTVQPDGQVVWGGSVGNPGIAQFNQFSTATWFSGSFLTGFAGATFAWAGPATLSGTTLLSGAATISNTLALSAVTTQTGVYTKSGATGYTNVRLTTADPASSNYDGSGAAIYIADPRAFDVYSVVSTGHIHLGYDSAWALGAIVRFYIPARRNVTASIYLQVDATTPGHDALEIEMNGTSGAPNGFPITFNNACCAVDFVLTSAGWQECMSAGFFT